MRHYDDDEVSQLLEHATQLQQAGEPEDPEEGVTLAELEEAAEEVGIRPRYIRRAAALLGNPGAKADSAISRWLGLSPHRLIQGEIGDEDWNSLIVEIERIVGRGTVKATSRSAGSFVRPCKTLQWFSADRRVTIIRVPAASPRLPHQRLQQPCNHEQQHNAHGQGGGHGGGLQGQEAVGE